MHGGGGERGGDRAHMWCLLCPTLVNQLAMATTTSRGDGSPYRRRDGEPVLEHRPGSVFVLFGEDDVFVTGGFVVGCCLSHLCVLLLPTW